MVIGQKIHAFWLRLPRWLRGPKAVYLYAAAGFLLLGSVAAVAQNSFTKTAFKKPAPTETATVTSSSPKTYNPMGTAADDPNSQNETNTPSSTPADSQSSATKSTFSVSVNPGAYTLTTADEQSPFFLASTSNGKAVYWTITGDDSVVPYEGASSSVAESSHQFDVKLSPNATPGQHTITITGSANGISSSTTMVITVKQGTTFTLTDDNDPKYAASGTTATVTFSFSVSPVGSNSDISTVKTTASLESSTGTITKQPSDTGSTRTVVVTVPSTYKGQINVQVTGTDSNGQTQTLALSHDTTTDVPTATQQ